MHKHPEGAPERALPFCGGWDISPRRRRVTLPTAAKSPKRRLETKVSKTFLYRLRGSPTPTGASNWDTAQTCAAAADLAVDDGAFVGPARAGAVLAW